MADDYTIASKVYVPQGLKDPLEMAKGIEQYRLLQNERNKSDIDLAQKNKDYQAIQNYGTSRDPQSFMGASPEQYNTATQGQKLQEEHKRDVMSRDAQMIAGEKDPKKQKYLWN